MTQFTSDNIDCVIKVSSKKEEYGKTKRTTYDYYVTTIKNGKPIIDKFNIVFGEIATD